MLDSINALGIKKREGASGKEYKYGDRKYVEVPNVTGLSVKEAMTKLGNFKVEFSGTGETVSYQSPKAGEKIYEGETVRLMLME